jgi:phage tail sheath protein FI
LANAVRSGARYGTVNAYSAGTHTCQSVIDKVRANAKTVGINDSNKTQVAVTVSFKNVSTGSTSTVCTAAAGTATAASGGSSLPCANVNGTPLTPDELTVDASYTSRLLVATPGLGKNVALTNSSAFQCEYYK